MITDKGYGTVGEDDTFLLRNQYEEDVHPKGYLDVCGSASCSNRWAVSTTTTANRDNPGGAAGHGTSKWKMVKLDALVNEMKLETEMETQARMVAVAQSERGSCEGAECFKVGSFKAEAYLASPLRRT